MPIYEYAVVNPDGTLGERFEVMQAMSDPPLTRHPERDEPVQRVISAPSLPLQWTDSADKSKLSDKNLDRLGFTKYQKSDEGTWEKRAGKGPDSITRD